MNDIIRGDFQFLAGDIVHLVHDFLEYFRVKITSIAKRFPPEQVHRYVKSFTRLACVHHGKEDIRWIPLRGLLLLLFDLAANPFTSLALSLLVKDERMLGGEFQSVEFMGQTVRSGVQGNMTTKVFLHSIEGSCPLGLFLHHLADALAVDHTCNLLQVRDDVESLF